MFRFSRLHYTRPVLEGKFVNSIVCPGRATWLSCNCGGEADVCKLRTYRLRCLQSLSAPLVVTGGPDADRS